MKHITRPVDKSILEPVFLRADGHTGGFVMDRLGGILLDFGFKGGKIHNGFPQRSKRACLLTGISIPSIGFKQARRWMG